MRAIFTILLVILLLVYAKVLLRVLSRSSGLTPILGWLVGLAYFLLAPMTILTLNGGFELPATWGTDSSWSRVDLTNANFLPGYLMIWASVLGSCLVVYLFMPAEQASVEVVYCLSRKKLERIMLGCIAFAITLWILQIRLVGGLDEFLVSHWATRSEDLFEGLGDKYVFVAHLAGADQILFTGAAALYTACGLKYRNTRWSFTVLIILFFLCTVVMTGNRIYLALYLLAWFTSCWILQRKKLIVAMLMFAPVMVLVFSAWTSLRHNISEVPDSVDTYVQGDYGNRVVYSMVNVTEAMSVMMLLHMVNDFGYKHSYLYGASYSRTLLSFIPRSLYPNKPINFPVFLAKTYEPSADTSFGATAVGEMYGNVGPLTLICFPLSTFALLGMNKWVSRRVLTRPLLGATIFVSLLWVTRSAFAENFQHFVVAYLLVLALRLESGLACSAVESGFVRQSGQLAAAHSG